MVYTWGDPCLLMIYCPRPIWPFWFYKLHIDFVSFYILNAYINWRTYKNFINIVFASVRHRFSVLKIISSQTRKWLAIQTKTNGGSKMRNYLIVIRHCNDWNTHRARYTLVKRSTSNTTVITRKTTNNKEYCNIRFWLGMLKCLKVTTYVTIITTTILRKENVR